MRAALRRPGQIIERWNRATLGLSFNRTVEAFCDREINLVGSRLSDPGLLAHRVIAVRRGDGDGAKTEATGNNARDQ